MINRAAAEKLFGNENPVGKVLSKEDNGKVIMGVIGNYKSKGEFMANLPTMFRMNETYENKTILIKVKPGTGIDFEEKLLKDISNVVKDWNTELTYLTDSRKNQHKVTFIPVIIFMIICIFLLVNVALGLFGVLNLNINKRRGEIGLRRAAGATEKNIVTQFLGEIWMLSAFSLTIGLLFAVQFPLMNVFDVASSVYIVAILAAMFLIFLIVTLCAWYPSHKASQVQPATALHED
jgi:putative ABC transport system permease protein